MGIESKHPYYIKTEEQWQRIRDSYKGSDAIKQKGEHYLPQLSGQTDTEYQSYKMRGVYYNGI